VQQQLKLAGVYDRVHDPLASTEFTYTRFLVPYLCGYQGWALFMDCDMLCRADVAPLLDRADDRYAALCVQHEHNPPDLLKMGGKPQTRYPRKNWSSLVLWNCGHPANRTLTPGLVNAASGAFLHRFQWLDDTLIGSLPQEWNWLVGWSRGGEPKILHFTAGIPGIHDGCSSSEYADEYFAAAEDSIKGDLNEPGYVYPRHAAPAGRARGSAGEPGHPPAGADRRYPAVLP
jgi:hypothetical protein